MGTSDTSLGLVPAASSSYGLEWPVHPRMFKEFFGFTKEEFVKLYQILRMPETIAYRDDRSGMHSEEALLMFLFRLKDRGGRLCECVCGVLWCVVCVVCGLCRCV